MGKAKKMSINQIKDKHIGKEGTLGRDIYELEMEIERLKAENERLKKLLWEQWSSRWILELKDVPEIALDESESRKNFELYLKNK